MVKSIGYKKLTKVFRPNADKDNVGGVEAGEEGSSLKKDGNTALGDTHELVNMRTGPTNPDSEHLGWSIDVHLAAT